MQTILMAAAESDGGVNPLFFVLGALALIVVSTLGPLSRMHERRDSRRRAASEQPAVDERSPDATDDDW